MSDQYPEVIKIMLDIDKEKSKEIRELKAQNQELLIRVEELTDYIKERDL